MDFNDQVEINSIRFSNSPRRWTQTIESLATPAQSVHPEHMESLATQADFTHRTSDFFDDESSVSGNSTAFNLPDLDSAEKQRVSTKRKRPPPSGRIFVSRCEPKRLDLPQHSEGHQCFDFTVNEQGPGQAVDPHTPSTKFTGSVAELDPLPDDGNSAPRQPKQAHISNCDRENPYLRRVSISSEQHDPRIGAHFLAHEFLLRGMLADGELMRSVRVTDGPVSKVADKCASLLPSRYRIHDPRSPKEGLFRAAGIERSAAFTEANKEHLIPPPINTLGAKKLAPEEYVRTPYPFVRDEPRRRDIDLGSTLAAESPASTHESILTLTIRKCNPNSRTRFTTITIPATNDYSAVRTTQYDDKEKYYRAAVFDDEQLSYQLRQSYIDLAGPTRYFLARKLTRIAISGLATRTADAGYGWILQPRTLQIAALKGFTDTFSEEKILQLYRKPSLGKSRYAFVNWAHRLAAATPLNSTPPGQETSYLETPGLELVRGIERPEGLEFIVSWSVSRIVLAFLIVAMLSVAAVLLWTFLGKNAALPRLAHGGGYLDAGDRVGVGILIGICVFVIGMGGLTGWLGVSWLVM